MYKIGEAARLLGLSTEALRYYERKGLIVPHKDSISNYRYFDASQINHLLNMQKYQKLGFTLYELMDLFENSENAVFLELMEQKEKELLQESVAMSLRLHSIHLSMECIALAAQAQQTIQFVKRPALYRISYMQDDVILSDDAALNSELKQWSKSSELQFLSARICDEDFLNSRERFDYGFCHFIEFCTSQCSFKVQRSISSSRDKWQGNLCLNHTTQILLRFFSSFLQTLHSHRILTQVYTVFLLEGIHHPVNDDVIEIITTQTGITVCRQYLKCSICQLQNGNVECTST